MLISRNRREHSLWLHAAYVVFVLLLASLSWRAEAITLGDLVVQSKPGAPLRAVIPVTLQDEESLAQLRVVIAPQEEYAVQKLQRPAELDGMQIALLSTGENRGRLQFFGKQPWQGGQVIMLLQLSWPEGQMSKRVTIAQVTTDDTAVEKNPLYVEVGPNESLDTIAIRLSKHSNRSYLHMMVALYRANPDAFYRDNLNNLRSGVRLRVPTDEELYQLSDAEVNATLREHKARWQSDIEKARQEHEEAQKRQKLQQVTRDNAVMERQNRELKERLARLEQQINSMSRQVIEHAKEKPEPPATQGDKASEPKAPAMATEPTKKAAAESGGISAGWMIVLMLLVGGSVVAIWRFAPRRVKARQ
jgi:FimV-like protein